MSLSSQIDANVFICLCKGTVMWQLKWVEIAKGILIYCILFSPKITYLKSHLIQDPSYKANKSL